jgi:hypothetical protein
VRPVSECVVKRDLDRRQPVAIPLRQPDLALGLLYRNVIEGEISLLRVSLTKSAAYLTLDRDAQRHRLHAEEVAAVPRMGELADEVAEHRAVAWTRDGVIGEGAGGLAWLCIGNVKKEHVDAARIAEVVSSNTASTRNAFASRPERRAAASSSSSIALSSTCSSMSPQVYAISINFSWTTRRSVASWARGEAY